jgi:hypothetical protein
MADETIDIYVTNTGDEVTVNVTPNVVDINVNNVSGIGSVTSVNTRTGDVLIDANDVGLGNVDNTGDFDKPVSNATQIALNLKADLVDGLVSVSQLPVQNLSIMTGLAEGGLLTINGDNTKFDLAAGFGYIVNGHSNPDVPTATRVNWSAKIANTIPNLATQDTSYVAIDINGDLYFTNSPLNSTQRRNYIRLGALIHLNNTTLDYIDNKPTVSIEVGGQVQDILQVLGFRSLSGNRIAPVNGNLKIKKEAGTVFKSGSNFNNLVTQPHTFILPEQNPITFRYRTQTGVEGLDITDINPAIYDVNGSFTAMPSTATLASVQQIYIFQDGSIRIQSGQTVFSNLSEALLAINSKVFITESDISENGLYLGSIAITRNATVLNDIANTIFVPSQGTTTNGSVPNAPLGYTPEDEANKQDSLVVDGTAAKYPTVDAVNTGLALKQATLVSGTTIKTINGTTLLGSGDIVVSGGGENIVFDAGISRTFAVTDLGKTIVFTNANPVNLTLPTNENVFIEVGFKVKVTQQGLGIVTASNAGISVISDSGFSSVQGETRTFVKIDTNKWSIEGNPVNAASASGVANTIYLDLVSGNDSTGTISNQSKPYLTLDAAFAVAVNSNIIYGLRFLSVGTYPCTLIPDQNFKFSSDYKVTIDFTASSESFVNKATVGKIQDYEGGTISLKSFKTTVQQFSAATVMNKDCVITGHIDELQWSAPSSSALRAVFYYYAKAGTSLIINVVNTYSTNVGIIIAYADDALATELTINTITANNSNIGIIGSVSGLYNNLSLTVKSTSGVGGVSFRNLKVFKLSTANNAFITFLSVALGIFENVNGTAAIYYNGLAVVTGKVTSTSWYGQNTIDSDIEFINFTGRLEHIRHYASKILTFRNCNIECNTKLAHNYDATNLEGRYRLYNTTVVNNAATGIFIGNPSTVWQFGSMKASSLWGQTVIDKTTF